MGTTTTDAVGEVLRRLRAAAEENDEDVALQIDGKVGSGKSTLAIRFCLELEPAWAKKLRQRCHYNPQSYLHASRHAGKGAAMLADEGMAFVYRRNAMKGTVKDFNEEMSKLRYRNQYHLLCIPDKDKADDDYSIGRVDFRIEALRTQKGWAYFYEPGPAGNWKRIFKFPFAPLEGTKVWEDYLAWKDYNLTDQPSQASEKGDPLSQLADQVATHQDTFQRLAQLADREALPWTKDT